VSSAAAPETPPRHPWGSLAGICLAAGIVWLAFSDFGVAVPTIASSLDADLDALQWANNAFSLVAGALVIAAGKAGDIYGRRRALEAGLVILAATSLLAALAPDTWTLIAGRGLMGIGAALILPATLALIPPQYTGAFLLTAFGAWQAVAWGGQAVGPAIGGGLTEALGWRWLFWINLPLAAVALVLVRRDTPESRDRSASRHIDLPGLVTIALAVFALLFALTDGPNRGWDDPVILGLFAATAGLVALWIVIELRVAEPLVNLRLFRARTFDGGLIANTTMNVAFAGMSFLLVLWLQDVRGYDAVAAGLLLLPATVGIFLFIPVGSRRSRRVGSKRPVVTGLAIMSVGVLLLGLIEDDRSLWGMAAALLLLGVGIGLLSTPISDTLVGDVPLDLAGTAAGVFKMSSMVGGAVGVALLSALSQVFGDDPSTISSSRGVAGAFVTTGVLALAATALVWLVWPRPPARPGRGDRG
jgi:EmrB/QacA subfamily drug resistance transporter